MKKIICGLLLFSSVLLFVGCGSDASIKVYTRNTDSGTRDGFFTTIGFKDAVKDNSCLVNGYVEVQNNDGMISSVKNDEFGIGYISLASLKNSGLKDLKYEGVSASEASVLDGTYKLTRNFNYITRNEYASDKVKQICEAYVAFLNTKDAKTTIKSKDGILTINQTDKTWNEIKANYPVCEEDNSSVTIRFGGSTSVSKMAEALSAEFSTKCGGFKAVHNHTGSGDAFKRTQGTEKDGANALDIAFASREFTTEEKVNSGTFGKICVDAIVVVVNSQNKLEAIDAQTLKKIYNGEASKWSMIG